jgi:hypothetical protein
MQSYWDCRSPDRRFLSCSYVLAMALSCCIWAYWIIFWVSLISNLWASMSSSNQTVSLDPAAFRRSLNVLVSFTTAFSNFLHCMFSTFCDCNNVCKVFLGVLMGVDGHVENGTIWKLDLQTCNSSLVVTKSVTGTYGTGVWLLCCLFLHSKSFNPSGALRIELILVCCQSAALSMSLLKEDLGGIHRNTAACVVAWKTIFAECEIPWSQNKLLLVPMLHVRPVGRPGTEQFWPLQKMHCSTWADFWIQSVLSILLSRWTRNNRRVVLPI